ncbi:MAG: hypothetical protein KF812_07835 [Fimbriimonadaceae bacterium]|nr:hypothetical protein [Fimbriimonadaceae bacterium]
MIADRFAFFRPSIRAVRGALAPMLLIQTAAATLIFAYFNNDSVRTVAAQIGAFKVQSGLLGAFVAGLIGGGIVPEIARVFTGKTKRLDAENLIRIGSTAFTYGVVGIQVDLLYNYQAVWFGQGNDAVTLLQKTAVDMLLFSPLLSIPTATYLLGWWQSSFSRRYWAKALTWKFFRDECLGAMPLCWSYWIPILLLTYALPLPLQFPFAILAESAWSIVFVLLVVDRGAAPEVAVP